MNTMLRNVKEIIIQRLLSQFFCLKISCYFNVSWFTEEMKAN